MSFEALERAVKAAGGQSALARAINVSQPSVWHWVHNSRRVPGEFVLAVERETGIARTELRPDLYPIEDTVPALAICPGCDHRADSGQVRSCISANCPMRARQGLAA